ncbi:hypothetical protein GCM10022223_12940 [Kineosporia mesophila]|uniref:Uncharacterized protein n=1 Tax=Kineosporia mesophila TaxID=566012 RepID=A0ABP6Z850_9ACTN|nr:hypothetical protein [Kineosporia mesophila]MCD5354972.1 hypothetical protein [Kineosporia mesophila]
MTTRTTQLWLLDDDLRAFGSRVRDALPGAWWMCSPAGPRGLLQVHAHAAADEAMTCGSGVQSFLPLPAGAQPPDGALVGAGVTSEPGLGVAALVQVQATRHEPGGPFTGETLHAGRLVVRWNASAVLDAQIEEIWRALTSVTQPHGSGRIGPAAAELARRPGVLLAGA